MAKIVINTELDTKQFNKQILKVQKDIKELEYEYEGLKKSKPFDGQSEMLTDYQSKIEKATNSLIKLKDAQTKLSLSKVSNIGYNFNSSLAGGFSLNNVASGTRAIGDLGDKTEYVADEVKDLKNAFDVAGESGEQTGIRTGQGFERGINSLKRFALGLFGIRSMFSLMRRATNAYLSQNETTANKLNAIWVALGNALGPIIEIIADGVLKLIGYLNVFLRALGFDIDLTKNMNKSTKAVQGTTKAMKELNNEVYSFDEISKQSKDTSVGGASGGGGSGTNGFTMPELDEGIVNRLKDIAGWLKENKDLLFAIGTIIAGYKVAKWLSGLGSLIGGGTGAGATGLLGLKNILTGLLALEAIAIVVSIIYYGKELSELKQINKEIEKFAKNNTESAKKVNQSNLDVAKSFEKGSEEIDKYVYELNSQIESSKNNIEVKKKENEQMGLLDHVWDAFGGTASKNNKLMQENTQRIINNAQNLQELAREGKLTDDQMKVYKDTMKYLNGVYDELSPAVENSTNKIEGFGFKVDETTQGLYDQIKSLQNTDREAKISTGNQKKYFESLWTTARNTFNNMNNLKANPKVDVSVNTKKLTSIFDTLIKTPGLSSADVSNFTWVSNALKRFGLAKGGIVNLPGKGVPLGNIVTGEATNGAEGFIPMNNEESMDLIGQAVARHVVINLTNNTMLDSRIIAREQTKIQNNQNFLTNGRGV